MDNNIVKFPPGTYRKQIPKSLLNFAHKIDGVTNAGYPVVGADDNLYYFDGGSLIKQTDITISATKTTHIDFAALGLGGVFAFNVFSSGVVYAVNPIVSEVQRGQLLHAADIDSAPSVIKDIAGSRFLRLTTSFYTDGRNEYVLAGEYAQTDTIKQLWFSQDGGLTYTAIKDTSGKTAGQNWHWHCAEYDPYEGRIWASEGDDPASRGIWYSDDNGETWEKIMSNQYQPTAIIPLLFGVFFGRDHGRPGLDGYLRQKTEKEIKVTATLEDTLTFRATESGALYYPERPVILGDNAYISFQGSPCRIYGTGDGGFSWHCVYAGATINNLAIKDGYLIGRSLEGGANQLRYSPLPKWE